MDISVIASSKMNEINDKENFDIFSGKVAGVCYMASSFNDLLNEDIAKTNRRINQTKKSGHHSVYDHNSISLYLENIPKIVAMILNNEKQYTTSEKSARYTKMALSTQEQEIYDKWLQIFKEKISALYKADYPDFFTDNRIEKLAQENARYLTSVFTPASMVYTTTYRQLNIIIAMVDKFVAKSDKNDFELKLQPYLEELSNKLKSLPYYDKDLSLNEKCRTLSLFNDRGVEEYFGDVYAVIYEASFACLAQAHRHRTIGYHIEKVLDKYYVPKIIESDSILVEEWNKDMNTLKDHYPQGTLLRINEMGTMDNFILKLKERKCTFAQLEVNNISNEVLNKYVNAIKVKNHTRLEELQSYTHGSRCTFKDYTCTAPCGFKLGINETRLI